MQYVNGKDVNGIEIEIPMTLGYIKKKKKKKRRSTENDAKVK